MKFGTVVKWDDDPPGSAWEMRFMAVADQRWVVLYDNDINPSRRWEVGMIYPHDEPDFEIVEEPT